MAITKAKALITINLMSPGNELLIGSRGFDWRKSPAHLAFLTTFLSPRPPDQHPTDTRWDLVLGELPEIAIERLINDKAVRACGTTETLCNQLPNLTSSRLKELLRERGLPTNGNKDELVRKLTHWNLSPITRELMPAFTSTSPSAG